MFLEKRLELCLGNCAYLLCGYGAVAEQDVFVVGGAVLWHSFMIADSFDRIATGTAHDLRRK